MEGANAGRFGIGHFGLGLSGLGHFGQAFFQRWTFWTNFFVIKFVELLCQRMLKHVNIEANSGLHSSSDYLMVNHLNP